jgi:AcrR family transcriptional regulator
MSLRKEKAARLKVQVLDNTLKLVGKKSFEDLYVDDICDKVKISKVTLFKYFPQKEDILMYYLRIWCLARTVELSQKPREGLAGIHYLFDKIAEEYEERPGFVLSLVGYLSDAKRPPKPFPVKPEEKRLLYPEVDSVATLEIYSVDQMLEKFVLEAIFRKEITKSTSTRDITNLISSMLFGGILVAHLNQQNPLKHFFRKTIDLALKGLNGN